jgi:isopentenyl diphosphate isomerase/L-lactate dehydrogenase-like FMN-dependent dehydrogenase
MDFINLDDYEIAAKQKLPQMAFDYYSSGAKAVLVGRPILWALAVNGSQGVQNVLTILKKELRLAMALTGCRSLAEINQNLIAPS